MPNKYESQKNTKGINAQQAIKNLSKEDREKFKVEVASELGLDLNSDKKMSKSEAGSIGGGMLKKMAAKLNDSKEK
ncbi:MAG: alpha/beta-type small acid-soluble spore protein [Clostridiaceae bacterium]|nr:alpha/beta-type small acid-soluble spore protein [Clostridiaceae bacterium]